MLVSGESDPAMEVVSADFWVDLESLSFAPSFSFENCLFFLLFFYELTLVGISCSLHLPLVSVAVDFANVTVPIFD